MLEAWFVLIQGYEAIWSISKICPIYRLASPHTWRKSHHRMCSRWSKLISVISDLRRLRDGSILTTRTCAYLRGAADITTWPFYLDMHTLPSTQSLSSSSSSSSSSCTRHVYPTHKDRHVLLLARVLTVLTLLPDHSILTCTPCHQTITQYYDHHSRRHSHHHHHAHNMRTLCMSNHHPHHHASRPHSICRCIGYACGSWDTCIGYTCRHGTCRHAQLVSNVCPFFLSPAPWAGPMGCLGLSMLLLLLLSCCYYYSFDHLQRILDHLQRIPE
jgi:hypothetical protein